MTCSAYDLVEIDCTCIVDMFCQSSYIFSKLLLLGIHHYVFIVVKCLLEVSVWDYYCTISGKWNEVTLPSCFALGLLEGDVGNNWGSRYLCFSIPFPSAVSSLLLLNPMVIVGCDLFGCIKFVPGLLTAPSNSLGRRVGPSKRSRVVGLNTWKPLCSVRWTWRFGLPGQKTKLHFYTFKFQTTRNWKNKTPLWLTCYKYCSFVGWDSFYLPMRRRGNLWPGWKGNDGASHNRLEVHGLV